MIHRFSFYSIFFVAAILCVQCRSYAQQNQDTSIVQKKPVHSANKAALYSAVIPGLGQAYNKKYWKIPVIYAGFGTFAYFINFNNLEYNKFRKAYLFKTGQTADPSYNNAYAEKYPEASLLDARDYYRRNRDFTIILTVGFYLLNIVDAAVDAYLFDYDVSENLSIRLDPVILPSSNYIPKKVTPQFSLTFRF